MTTQEGILPPSYEEQTAFGGASQRLDLVWQPPVKPHRLKRINKQVFFCMQPLQQRGAVSASYPQPLQSMKDAIFCNSNLRITNYGSGNQHQHETSSNSAVKNFITVYTSPKRKSSRLMISTWRVCWNVKQQSKEVQPPSVLLQTHCLWGKSDLPWACSEKEAIEETGAEFFNCKFITQQCEVTSEQMQKYITEGQVTERLNCTT